MLENNWTIGWGEGGGGGGGLHSCLVYLELKFIQCTIKMHM